MHKGVAMWVALVCSLFPQQALPIPNPDTGPGCGLGKILWSKSMNQKNILPQVFMVTTNLTGFQTFAISSGTSGCSNDGVLWADTNTEAFVTANYEDLIQEMAQGQGEHLASLASMLGVRENDYADFFAMTQREHDTLTRSSVRNSTLLLWSLLEDLSQHPSLSYVSFGR